MTTEVANRHRAAVRADSLAQFNTQSERVAAILTAAEDHDKAEGVGRVTAEQLQEIRDHAWKQGYQACYEGRQRHSPYQPARAE